MSDESVSATRTIDASPERVFAVLCDPARHVDIDGTGWVESAMEDRRLTGAGQVFRVRMFHPDHPDGNYEIHNLVVAFEAPTAIAWKPGFVADETGELDFGGWVWRYDLAPRGPDRTEVTHTYDWSGVGPGPREHLDFPPFPADHLANSLDHLAELVREASGQ